MTEQSVLETQNDLLKALAEKWQRCSACSLWTAACLPRHNSSESSKVAWCQWVGTGLNILDRKVRHEAHSAAPYIYFSLFADLDHVIMFPLSGLCTGTRVSLYFALFTSPAVANKAAWATWLWGCPVYKMVLLNHCVFLLFIVYLSTL